MAMLISLYLAQMVIVCVSAIKVYRIISKYF